MKRLSTAVAGIVFVFAVGLSLGSEGSLERAREIAQRTILTDGHIDAPYRLTESWADLSRRNETGEFDYARAREGGLDAPFMSIYTPAATERQGRAKSLADSLIDIVHALATDHSDKFALATSPAEVERNFDNDLLSLCIGMENGAPIEGDLANVEYFHSRGVRYITLTHSEDNHICDSSYDTTGTWQGLSEFGEEVVREMNRVGIMVDISHVSDTAFWQVMDITEAPVIASHSSCRHFLPGFERNISDEMIRRVANNGGVVQINFGSTFVSKKARQWADEYKSVRDPYYDEHNIDRGSAEDDTFLESYRAKKPFPFANISMVADHIDHVVEVAGIEHVGFGSDFDGVGWTMPIGLKSVADYPNLIAELLDRGYSEPDIEKICYQNVFRVWREVEVLGARRASSATRVR